MEPIPKIIPLRQVPPIQEEPPDPRIRWAKESVLRTAISHRTSLTSKISRWREELGMPPEDQTRSAEHLSLLAHLKQIEWGGVANPYHHICPACAASRGVGHAAGCWIAEVLA